jgi:hypothetical protein
MGPGDGEEQGPPEIEFFRADPGEIEHGKSLVLSWRAKGATSASILPDNVDVNPTSGALSRRPFEPITYTLFVSNDHGTDEAELPVVVNYRGGIYVDSVNGDDDRDGLTPAKALRTLDAALPKAQDIGVIFLSAGEYASSILIDGRQLEIYGGLNPETFFEEAPGTGFDSRLRPTSGVPVTIRNIFEAVILSNLELVAPAGAEVGVDIQDAGSPFRRCAIVGCTINGRASSEGIGLRVRGGSTVTVSRCKIYGGRDLITGATLPVTRGVLITDDSNARVSNCFIDGGAASTLSSGVEIETTGTVGLGLNTISAELGTFGGTNSAAVRVRQGTPAVGNNLLFTQGFEPRFGILEEGDPDLSNVVAFEGNLFALMGAVPYRNSNGIDAVNEVDLNDPAKTTQNFNGFVFGNILDTTPASQIFLTENLPAGNYHLGPSSPAVDASDGSARREFYGAVTTTGDLIELGWKDIDGTSRPSNASRVDIGADEL